MNIMTILQVSEIVLRKSAEIAQSDPHGIIITVVSVLVVFGVLAILYCAYRLTGLIVNNEYVLRKTGAISDAEEETDEEVEAAITTALHLYLDENSHDNESNIITIKRCLDYARHDNDKRI